MTPAEIVRLFPERLEALRRLAFPDVWFTRAEQGGALSLPLRVRTEALRFSLEKRAPLHLGALALETEQPPHRVVGLRSVEAEIVDHDHRDHLLSAGFPWVCFETSEEKPCLTLEFEPATLTRILIDNRPEWHQDRAWSLRIEVRAQGGRWRTIWRHASRAAAFARAARSAVPEGLPPQAARLALRATLQAMALDPALRVTLDRLVQHRSDLVAPLKEALNETILLPRRREATSHGILRTFRFWQPEEKAAAILGLNKVRAALERKGIPACLAYGALLGFVREGDLIPHDDDVDLIALLPTLDLAQIQEALEGSGFICQVASPYHVGVWHPQDPYVSCDVFVAVQKDEQVRLTPARDPLVPLSALLPFGRVSFLGTLVEIPADPFRMLEAFYGPSWRVPDRGFAHDFGSGS
ncbi:LicD family protein [Sabulicella rubraurantiaca]|uniref:LicD family protein n=1 Tax=Sabulicella rubraurantiaca TaxID=2811429 RepID=UPI001A95D28B|nr:LicD family protein [Sabulicella rubraurantiaca]